MLTTRFTELIGCALPLQQAGMGGVATADLARAVSEAGALGMIGAAMVPAAQLAQTLVDLPSPVGVNFLMPFVDTDAVEAAAGAATLVEFFYGDPDPALVERVHKNGNAKAAWQVGDADEARRAEQAACDLIVAQGVEAGGHVRGTIGLLPLLDGVLDAVGDQIPVVAAGGIGTAKAVKAVLAAGADAARIGTRFVAAEEADTHPEYAQALVDAGPDDTVLTTAFGVMWPDAPHRVLKSCVDAAGQFAEGDAVGELVMGEVRMPLPPFAVPCPGRTTTGTVKAMALYAGQSVGAVTKRQPAVEIVRELTADL
ncbi:MAG: nitronate monooxygenase [Acidimicrobiia bacterium]|nr:nitronate monooxygenase [Acidimicrobiia bacterium]